MKQIWSDRLGKPFWIMMLIKERPQISMQSSNFARRGLEHMSYIHRTTYGRQDAHLFSWFFHWYKDSSSPDILARINTYLVDFFIDTRRFFPLIVLLIWLVDEGSQSTTYCYLEILQERSSFYSESNTSCVLQISTMFGNSFCTTICWNILWNKICNSLFGTFMAKKKNLKYLKSNFDSLPFVGRKMQFIFGAYIAKKVSI